MKKLRTFEIIFCGVTFIGLTFIVADIYFNQLINNRSSSLSPKYTIQTSEQLVELKSTLKDYNFEIPYDSLNNQRVIKKVRSIVSQENLTTSQDFRTHTLAAINDLTNDIPVTARDEIKSIRNDLNQAHSILEERRYRQRYSVQSVRSEFQSRVSRVLVDNNPRALIDFATSINDLRRTIEESGVREEYKNRVYVHLDSISTTLRSLEHKVNRIDIAKESIASINDLIGTEVTDLTKSMIASQERAINLIDHIKKRMILYFLFLLSLVAVLAMALLKVYALRHLSHLKIRQRFQDTLNETKDNIKKINTIKQNQSLSMAMISTNGKVIWSTLAFRRLFSSKSARKKGWSFLKQNYLLETERLDDLNRSYIIKDNPNHEVVISESKCDESKTYSLICITDAKSYFNDLKRPYIQKFGHTKELGSLEPYIIIDQVIEESLLVVPSALKSLNVSFEYTQRIPRPIRTNPSVVQDIISTICEMTANGANVFGTPAKLNIDYSIHDSYLTMHFKYRDLTIDHSTLTTPLSIPSDKTNTWEYLSTLESRYSSLKLSVSIKNKAESRQHVSDHWGCIEIKFMINRPPTTGIPQTLKSKLREPQTAVVV